jgi:hypothetical protein
MVKNKNKNKSAGKLKDISRFKKSHQRYVLIIYNLI